MAEIVPAILTNDISDFRKQYAELFAFSHLFKKLHVDFADGEFVPNKTVMPSDLGFLKSSPLELMAHFMAYNPFIYFHHAKQAGFKWILFHFEAFENRKQIEHAAEHAEHLGLKSGLVINPETPVGAVEKVVKKVSMIQIMGIHPGFQGRNFLPDTVGRIIALRKMAKHAIIAVDGGEKVGVAERCVKAGAELIVAGSAILGSKDPKHALEELAADINLNK